MADKIHSALVNTLLCGRVWCWRWGGHRRSAQQAVTGRPTTHAQAKRRSPEAGTIETARDESAALHIETLVQTKPALIDTLTEVEASSARAVPNAMRAKLREMEEQLKHKLLEMRNRAVEPTSPNQPV